MGKIHYSIIPVLLLLLFPAILNRTFGDVGTVMRVQPASIQNISVGQSFTVNLTVADVPALFTWQIMLFFDSTILNCTAAVYPTAGGIFTGHNIIPVSPIIDNTAGSVSFGASLSGSDIASGSGVLCQITFEVKGTGTSDLKYSTPYGADTFLLEGDLNVVYSSLENGFFTNVPTPPPTRHDVAVTGLSFSNENPIQGESITITTLVLNNGTITEGAFNVSVSNGTSLIETQTVTDLAAAGSKALTFIWNTSGAPLGENTITANATAVPTETNLGNNIRTGVVTVLSSIQKSADINSDGRFDMKDVALVCWSYGTHLGDTRWRDFADIAGPQGVPDGTIDQYDIAAVVKNFWRITKP